MDGSRTLVPSLTASKTPTRNPWLDAAPAVAGMIPLYEAPPAQLCGILEHREDGAALSEAWSIVFTVSSGWSARVLVPEITALAKVESTSIFLDEFVGTIMGTMVADSNHIRPMSLASIFSLGIRMRKLRYLP